MDNLVEIDEFIWCGMRVNGLSAYSKLACDSNCLDYFRSLNEVCGSLSVFADDI